MFLGQFFVKNAKNDAGTLFERPKSENLKNRENAEMSGNSVKMAFFTFKAPKLGHFSRYLPENVYTYTPDNGLSHTFRFRKFGKIIQLFEINIFY